MNPDTGAIARFETEQDAREAGYTQPLTEEQVTMLQPMNRQQRRAWAAEQRHKNPSASPARR
jgi:hypothetical protein